MPQSRPDPSCSWVGTFLSVAVRSCDRKEQMCQARDVAATPNQVTAVPEQDQSLKWPRCLWRDQHSWMRKNLAVSLVRLTLPHLCFSVRSFYLCWGHSNFLRPCGNGESSPFPGPGYWFQPAITPHWLSTPGEG